MPVPNLILQSPISAYSAINCPTQIVGVFDASVGLATGTVKLWHWTGLSGSLIHTFSQADIVVTGATFTITLPTPLNNVWNYYVTISANLFTTTSGNYGGISNHKNWPFQIKTGEYDGTEYDNYQYLTT
jgi:hypothetical protein